MEYLISQIAQAAARGLEPSTGRLQRNVVGAAITALFATIALLSAFATGWFAIYERRGPVLASAYMTGAAIIVALLAWTVVAIMNKRAEKLWEAERKRVAAKSAMTSGSLLALTELPGLIKASPIVTVVSVAGIAYALIKSRR